MLRTARAKLQRTATMPRTSTLHSPRRLTRAPREHRCSRRARAHSHNTDTCAILATESNRTAKGLNISSRPIPNRAARHSMTPLSAMQSSCSAAICSALLCTLPLSLSALLSSAMLRSALLQGGSRARCARRPFALQARRARHCSFWQPPSTPTARRTSSVSTKSHRSRGDQGTECLWHSKRSIAKSKPARAMLKCFCGSRSSIY